MWPVQASGVAGARVLPCSPGLQGGARRAGGGRQAPTALWSQREARRCPERSGSLARLPGAVRCPRHLPPRATHARGLAQLVGSSAPKVQKNVPGRRVPASSLRRNHRPEGPRGRRGVRGGRVPPPAACVGRPARLRAFHRPTANVQGKTPDLLPGLPAHMPGTVWSSSDSRQAGEQNPRPLLREPGRSGEAVRGAVNCADLGAAPPFDALELNDICGGHVCPGPRAWRRSPRGREHTPPFTTRSGGQSPRCRERALPSGRPSFPLQFVSSFSSRVTRRAALLQTRRLPHRAPSALSLGGQGPRVTFLRLVTHAECPAHGSMGDTFVV